jgi:antitoxin component of MazEF toxin-antitoxin module
MARIPISDELSIQLPAELCQQAGVEAGDFFEVSWEDGRLVLTPKLLMDVVVEKLGGKLVPPDYMVANWEAARQAGTDKMTMDEINEEIAAARREMREQEKELAQPKA